MTQPVATPRPIISPEPIVWGGVVLTVAAAGVIGGAVAWVVAKWLGLP